MMYNPIKAPAISTSPWAKCSTPRTPKIKVYPMATKEYVEPNMSPLISCWMIILILLPA